MLIVKALGNSAYLKKKKKNNKDFLYLNLYINPWLFPRDKFLEIKLLRERVYAVDFQNIVQLPSRKVLLLPSSYVSSSISLLSLDITAF